MKLQKFRWSRVYESSEEELTDVLYVQDIQAARHHIEEFQVLETSAFDADTIMWCAEGSIIFDFGSERISLQAGDGLNIPANYGFTATAGISGCVYYQAA